jgi:DNA-directed RNA polymerase specialized sigma24 family protein
MELLERFAAGDLEAFEALFRQHQREVYAWTVRIVRDGGAAEDLTVETFWRIYRSRGRFDPQGNFRAWARRIATNAALDHFKRVRRASLADVRLTCPRGQFLNCAIPFQFGIASRCGTRLQWFHAAPSHPEQIPFLRFG